MTRDWSKEDKILDRYLEGELPFSDIYGKAAKDEECPDSLSTKILAIASRRNRPISVNWIATSLPRRKRIVIEATLLVAAAAALIVTINIPSNNPELECPATSAADESSADPATRTRDLKP